MSTPVADPAAGVVIEILAVGVILLYALQRLGRTRPGMRIGRAIALAYVIRLLAIVAVNATGLGASLRGGDELTFMSYAEALAQHRFGTDFLPHGIFQLQTVVFALQLKLGFINESGLRVAQVGIALLGFIFMLTTVYDLAGPRATWIAAWCLAVEPSSIFFNTEIHKEPLMELAAGLAAFGGVWIWKRLDIRGIAICAVACTIGIETRGYAGWFLACGCIMLILHASLRNTARKGLSISLIYAIAIAAMIAAPTVLAATSGKNLSLLQRSQAQNSSGIGQVHANLALESVDVSSRGAVISSLPTKLRELILQPYPWQLHDSSQAFGSIGTLVAYAILILLIRYAWLSRGEIFGRAGPLLYPMLFEMIAYAVTVGNAGTGFRYRSHLVSLGICCAAVLRARVREQREEDTQAGLDATDLPTAQDAAQLPWEPATA